MPWYSRTEPSSRTFLALRHVYNYNMDDLGDFLKHLATAQSKARELADRAEARRHPMARRLRAVQTRLGDEIMRLRIGAVRLAPIATAPGTPRTTPALATTSGT